MRFAVVAAVLVTVAVAAPVAKPYNPKSDYVSMVFSKLPSLTDPYIARPYG